MTPITLYRLEHPHTGLGPYWHSRAACIPESTCRYIQKMGKKHDQSRLHPDAFDDFIEHPVDWAARTKRSYKDLRFGCDSEEKLRDWFRGYFRPLLRLGFQIKTYQTINYRPGLSGRQHVFLL